MCYISALGCLRQKEKKKKDHITHFDDLSEKGERMRPEPSIVQTCIADGQIILGESLSADSRVLPHVRSTEYEYAFLQPSVCPH